MPTFNLESITQANGFNTFSFDIENTDSGTSYTSLNMGQNFLNTVWNDGRLVDQSLYTGFEDFVAEAAPRFLIDGLSDVSAGWSDSTNNSTGITKVNKNFSFSDNYDFGDSMIGTYRVETDAFRDSVMFYKDPQPGSIGLSFVQESNPFGTAYTDSLDSLASGSLSVNATSAVPEPGATSTLFALTALAVIGYNKLKRSNFRK